MQEMITESLLSAVPMALVLIGPDERIELLNPAAQSLLGARLPGRHYITALRQPLVLDCIEAVLNGMELRQTRYLSNEAGREATYRVQCAPVDRVGGRGVLVSFDDVTDLEEAGQIRRDFVANVSHELRTPLTALLGFIQTLRGSARDDAAARDRFLTIMETEAERMNRLVLDLLSLSRVEADERLRPTDRIDLGGCIASAVQALRPLASESGVTLRFERPDGPVKVPGDLDQLQQVFINLIENAIKYGGPQGEVFVRLSPVGHAQILRGPGAAVVVEDTGEGIPPQHVPRLTERFYRVDAHRSRAQGGTGLGLAIVKHIVNRHRGRLRIDSAPGQGSRFSVILPAD